MSSDRIALIAVHGVADQKPGDTARALVGLLVASPPDDPAFAPTGMANPPRVRYVSRSEDRFEIPVDPLKPLGAPTSPRADATPLAEDRPLVKSFLQSFRSDLQRPGWRAADEVTTAWRKRHEPPPEDAGDRGLAVTNYLLTKHIDNGAHREAYETTCVRLDREAEGSSSKIDVYEMYWADLSRLSGQVPRIITELFTMVFRLSKLGRDTVDEARGRIASRSRAGARHTGRRVLWTLLASLQAGLDWVFVNVLALLFLQLLLLVTMLGGFRLLLRPELDLVHAMVCGALAIGALLWLAYHWRGSTPRTVLLPFLVLALSLTALFAWKATWLWTAAAALLILAVATWLNEAGLAVANDRFPFVRTAGRCLWLATLLVVVAAGLYELKAKALLPTAPLQAMDAEHLALHSWMHATLFATEVVLAAVKLWWEWVPYFLAAWFALGGVLSWRRGYAEKASIATGRLGLAVSLGTFLTLTMAGWALLTTVTNLSASGIAYSSCIFPSPDRAASAGTPASPASSASAPQVESPSNVCLRTTAEAEKKRGGAGRVGNSPAAGAYLDSRFHASTESFAALAGLLILLVIYLAIIFLPSVLAELKLLVQAKRQAFHRALAKRGYAKDSDPAAKAGADLRNRQLGRWLSAGYRRLDVAVLILVGLGVLIAVVVGAIFFGHLRSDSRIPLPSWLGSWTIGEAEARLRVASDELLAPLVISAAGVAAALTAFGGWLSKYVPPIRAPLDIMLDVDNYFRDFPRTDIVRARIFSRYAALLGHVQQQGYDAVVVVAHSQGTVITAELLRFLSSDGHHAPRNDDRPQLIGGALPPVSLLTLGCPLRQLYASRFPLLYDWVIKPGSGRSGPRAADIGVERWANAFSSGDYVGRWLRSDSANPDDPIGHPMSDLVDDRDGRGLGRIDAYAGFVPMPPTDAMLLPKREIEVCLGIGAHTHYFEPDQSTVAWLVDYLIRTGTRPNESPATNDGVPRGRDTRAVRDQRARNTGTLPRLLSYGAALGILAAMLNGIARRADDKKNRRLRDAP